jgi:thymidylate kinase
MGHYTVLEGLDGVGKGVVEDVIKQHIGQNVGPLEIVDGFFRDYENNPTTLRDYTFLAAEPTFIGSGMDIRQEVIARNGRSYPAETQIEVYGNNRFVLLRRCILPLLGSGNNVLSSRNFISSTCYQALVAKKEGKSIDESRERVLAHAGNRFALSHSPTLAIISTIADPQELTARLSKREKKDNCEFENFSFQLELNPFYRDPWLRELLEKAGTKVAYLDAGISLDATKQQAVEIYSDFYERGVVQPRYQNP